MYIADKPTSAYTMLESIDMSPKMADTRLKLSTPTSPQFRPPTITRTRANQSTMLRLFILYFVYFLYTSRP